MTGMQHFDAAGFYVWLQIYDAMDTSKAMFTVAKGTKMTDYMISSYEALPEQDPHVLAGTLPCHTMPDRIVLTRTTTVQS
jgi:hypothetical protein